MRGRPSSSQGCPPPWRRGISTPTATPTPPFRPADPTIALATEITSLSLADVNGDGTPDLVGVGPFDAGNYPTDTVTVLTGNGDGTFAAPLTFVTEEQPTAVTTGDVNGDGRS